MPFGHRHLDDLPEAPTPGLAAAVYDPLKELTERVEASRRGMDQRLAQAIQSETSRHGRPITLGSFLLIPEKVWRGRHGQFLLHALGLNPYDPWNVAIAPLDDASAELVHLPRAPAADTPERLAHCNETLQAARRHYGQGYEIEDWTADRGDLDAARQAAREEVRQLALLLREDYVHPDAHVLGDPVEAPPPQRRRAGDGVLLRRPLVADAAARKDEGRP